MTGATITIKYEDSGGKGRKIITVQQLEGEAELAWCIAAVCGIPAVSFAALGRILIKSECMIASALPEHDGDVRAEFTEPEFSDAACEKLMAVLSRVPDNGSGRALEYVLQEYAPLCDIDAEYFAARLRAFMPVTG